MQELRAMNEKTRGNGANLRLRCARQDWKAEELKRRTCCLELPDELP